MNKNIKIQEKLWKKLLTATAMVTMICGCLENGDAKLSDAIVNIVANPIVGPATLGNDFSNIIGGGAHNAQIIAERIRQNLDSIILRAALSVVASNAGIVANTMAAIAGGIGAGAGIGAPAVAPATPEAIASENVIANLAALVPPTAALHPSLPVLAASAPLAGIANREVTLFRDMVKLRHLWKWSIAGVPANPNLNYLAWCRAARVNSGLPAGGIHSSFFVPNGTHANAYFALLLERIATAAANANNVIVAHNGANITPIPGGFPGGMPALAPALGGGNHIVQIFVNITGAAHIGGAAIQGIKCNLTGGPLPAALAPVGGIPGGIAANVQNALNAGSSIREYFYSNEHVGAAPVAGAFVALHGGAVATAAATGNISVIEIRITKIGGAVPHFSMYPL